MKTSILSVGCFFVICSSASAATTGFLDQYYEPTSLQSGIIVEDSQTVAQTFTVGLSGVLDRVEVELARNIPIPSPEGVTVEIRSTLPGGSPSSNVLASVFIPAADIWTSYQFIECDLTSFGLTVAEGDVLALVLSSDASYQLANNPFPWHGDVPGGYPRGAGYVDIHTDEIHTGFFETHYDFGFRTYVVPEPSDTTPPEFESIEATPQVLWPPNHRMVAVSVLVNVVDDTDPSPLVHILGVTSNQPVGLFGPDWEITGPLSVNLRAEMLGTAQDRTYTINVECEDASGNKAYSSVDVAVPHDRRPY